MLRKDLLHKTKDAIEEIKLPFKLRKEKKSLESWIIGLEEEEADLELKINELKSAKDLNIDEILDTIDSLALTNRRLKQGRELMEELFGGVYNPE